MPTREQVREAQAAYTWGFGVGVVLGLVLGVVLGVMLG